MSSSERVAIVTGAGAGIGKSVALALLQERYSVVLAGRTIPQAVLIRADQVIQ